MATDLERFYQLLVAGIGFDRKRDARLEYQAARRAFEARQQVGLTGSTPIEHPGEAVMQQRLGSDWRAIPMTELAVWTYSWHDPLPALVDATASDGRKVGLLNTEPHRSLLLNTSYTHWGGGLRSELPPGATGATEVRYYGIVWLSVEVPKVKAFVASGESLVDALAGGPLAARNGGNIFLTRKDSVPGVTMDALMALKPDEIIVLGSEGVVSQTVVDRLKTLAPVRRIGGADRYVTAALISKT